MPYVIHLFLLKKKTLWLDASIFLNWAGGFTVQSNLRFDVTSHIFRDWPDIRPGQICDLFMSGIQPNIGALEESFKKL